MVVQRCETSIATGSPDYTACNPPCYPGLRRGTGNGGHAKAMSLLSCFASGAGWCWRQSQRSVRTGREAFVTTGTKLSFVQTTAPAGKERYKLPVRICWAR